MEDTPGTAEVAIGTFGENSPLSFFGVGHQ